MSSTISSRHDPPSKTWWPLSSKPSSNSKMSRPLSAEKSLQSPTKQPSAITFNSFASAMGFKSKKHPSLTIQEPPSIRSPISPATSLNSFPPSLYTNRPPSKSVSSTRSPVDSIEPRTPSDLHRDPIQHRQSLLTLSDLDPFAGRGIASPSHHAPSDPNRLSAYSNTSSPEYSSKKADPLTFSRSSYASSSSNSNSNNHASDFSPHNSNFGSESPKKLSNKRSTGSLRRKPSARTAADSLNTAWENLTLVPPNTMIKSDSSATLTDKNRFSQPESTPRARPPMRARGMTDGGGGLPPPNIYSESSSNPRSSPTRIPTSGSPRVIIRQASVSRIGQPPSAPPRQDLPPPPHRSSEVDDDIEEPTTALECASASSSSLSFASSVSSGGDILIYNPYLPRNTTSERPSSTPGKSVQGIVEPSGQKISAVGNSPRTLKKAVSHQSLGKRPPIPAAPLPLPPVELNVAKTPRKQRSFHQPNIPMPQIPLPLHPVAPTSGSLFTTAPILDNKRGSANGSTSNRKRLFSGSSHRRPSTSQGTGEEDARSLFSLPSEIEHTMGSFLAHSSSYWDEGPEHSSPPRDYEPRRIMSPAEMAKLEASVDDASTYSRKRGMSVMSASTMASERDDEYLASGLNPIPSPFWEMGRGGSSSSRTTSFSSYTTQPPRSSTRPSTSPGRASPPHSPDKMGFSVASSSMTSLPPPPRPKPRPLVSVPAPKSNLGMVSLPPPPVRKKLGAKASIEKILHRQSLMRKPSFLDIDDETDKESEQDLVRQPVNDSFLDLARESFDTVRTLDA